MQSARKESGTRTVIGVRDARVVKKEPMGEVMRRETRCQVKSLVNISDW